MKTKHLFTSLALGLGLTLALLGAFGVAGSIASAEAPRVLAAELRVCPAGPPTCDYDSLQAAVDAANPGDLIKVAQGTYTDIYTRNNTTQVVYITKTVTVQGGYTTADWDTPDPAANPTTLDAQGLGRVVVISGTITPTVAGLRITSGAGGGSAYIPENSGGGIAILRAAAVISNCVVFSNTAHTGYGGGIYLDNAHNSLLVNNTVEGNEVVNKKGGGIALQLSNNVILQNNVVTDNVVYGGSGGGVCLQYSDNVTLTNNTVSGNAGSGVAGASGGGLFAYNSDDITLRGNTISNNVANVSGAGYGGGLYIWSSANVTLQENTVYSNTASLGGTGYGGGVHLASSSDLQMSGNTVQENKAAMNGDGYGGGLYLQAVMNVVTLTDNQILSNTASVAGHGWGGGAHVWNVDGAAFSNNTVQGNAASTGGAHSGLGGGFLAYYSDNLALNDNTFIGNTAGVSGDSWGGGLALEFSDNAALSGNTVQGNVANSSGNGTGGGLYIELSDYAALSGNTIVSNTATLGAAAVGWGGGLAIESCKSFTLINNLVADNQANSRGSGLWFEGDAANPTAGRLLHSTIADNHSSGQGVFVDVYAAPAFTNTIIAGHAGAGITVTAGSTATLEATLWYNNGAHTGGGGSIVTGTVNIYDDPAFVDAAAWDYHLTAGSAAIDAGVDAGVAADIDGQSRDANPDIGADEFGPSMQFIYLPLILRQ